MPIRSRSRLASGAAWPALALMLWCACAAHAGSPAALDGGATGPSKAAASTADTSRRAMAKAKGTTAPTKGIQKGAGAKVPAAPAPTAAVKGSAVARIPAAAKPGTQPARVAGVPGAPNKATTTARPVVPARNPTVAQVGRPGTGAPASVRRIATASSPATVTKLAPGQAPRVGPALARTGGTTVRGPGTSETARPQPTASVTRLEPSPTQGVAKTAKAAAVTGAVAGVVQGSAGAKSSPSTAGAKAPAVTAPLEDHVTYQYNALGRRDPFQSLMEGEYVGADVGGQAPPDLGGLKVYGIVWGTNDQFAMVEDVRGDSYVLRRGDRVMNGYVEGLKRDAMIVNITVDGQSQSVSIPITRKGEKSNANR